MKFDDINRIVEEIQNHRAQIIEDFAKAYLAHLPGDPMENISRVELVCQYADSRELNLCFYFRLKEGA